VTPLIVRLQDVEQAIASGGGINHALRMTLDTGRLANALLWPGTATGGSNGGLNYYGERIRLKSSFNISGFSSTAQILLTQAKNYGFIIADGGSNMAVDGEYTKWPSAIYTALLEIGNANIASSNFEVVDESGYEISPSSGECTCNRETVTFTRTSDMATASTDIVLTGVTVNFPYDRIQIQVGAPAYQLTALVNGASNASVTWSMNPTLGTLSSGGLYTPPGSVSVPTAVTITATSIANPSIAAQMTMNVFPAGAIRLIPGSVPGPSYGYQTTPTNYTDGNSNVWYSTGDDGGYANDQGPVSGTTDSKLFEYGFTGYAGDNDFRFDFIVPNGTYKVTYNAASPFSSSGYTQNLEYNGTIVYPNLDIYVASGGTNMAWSYTTNVTVSNNVLSLVNRMATIYGGTVGSILITAF
jgi:hypothetical protein